MKQLNVCQQLAYDVYLKRRTLLLETIDPENLVRITQMDGLQKIEKAIEKMGEQDLERQKLTSYLIIHATRCWQGYVTDKNGKQRYPKRDTSATYQQEIIAYMWMIEYYVREDRINILKYTDLDQMNRVKANLKKNIEIVQEAIQYNNIKIEDIDQYFQEIQVFTIDGSLYDSIYGLSTYDGKILYITKKANKQNLQDKFIEALIVDHLYQWFIKNKDPFYQQQSFASWYSGLLLTPQDFYLLEIYKQKAWHFSQFSFQMCSFHNFLRLFSDIQNLNNYINMPKKVIINIYKNGTISYVLDDQSRITSSIQGIYSFIFLSIYTKQMSKQLNEIENLLTKQYLINLFIAFIRAWEGYDEENFYQPIFDLNPYKGIQTSYDVIKAAISNPPIISISENEALINRAKVRYRIHKIILTKICQTEITDQLLNEFFQFNKIYETEQIETSALKRLSSFNGQYTYVKSGLDKELIINSLMHEFTHNLFRFGKKNKDFNYLDIQRIQSIFRKI